ncbi:MAG: transcription antitermination factor NusB [Candidatus Omnitrophota bacterium]
MRHALCESMRLRSKAREIALHILYQIEIANTDYQSAYQNYLKNYPQKQEVIDFALTLIEGVSKNIQNLDSLIKKYVKNWEIDRMAVIDRNILRLACFEIINLPEIPPKVSINEAIELAKRFGDIDSPRFVNGILDKIYKMESKKTDETVEKDSSCKA